MVYLPSTVLVIWTLANACITGVLIGRRSSVVTRVFTEKRQSPVDNNSAPDPMGLYATDLADYRQLCTLLLS